MEGYRTIVPIEDDWNEAIRRGIPPILILRFTLWRLCRDILFSRDAVITSTITSDNTADIDPFPSLHHDWWWPVGIPKNGRNGKNSAADSSYNRDMRKPDKYYNQNNDGDSNNRNDVIMGDGDNNEKSELYFNYYNDDDSDSCDEDGDDLWELHMHQNNTPVLNSKQISGPILFLFK
ncbi:hypothetical protein LSM04_004675 [Trypanosoma melophagium]|uniref:uncharacterized protein n=1 Tax=Trypanosoma melophagium TaxID=715481 RepID=UPI00351A0309|nr:hypothetical protein LSM04_004675 [Trypanosoma melophagium]